MSSTFTRWARAAALTTLASSAFADEQCRGPEQLPDLDVRKLANVLSHTDIEQWPAIGQYSDEYLTDVGRWLRSANGLRDLTREAEAIMKEEIIDKLENGETVDWDAVIDNVGFGAHDVVKVLQDDAANLSEGKVETAIEKAKKGINAYGKEAAQAVFDIVNEAPKCEPGKKLAPATPRLNA